MLIIISLFDFPDLLNDMIFSLSNIFLFVIYFSDNDQSFILYRKIFNISEFQRLSVKISLIFLLLVMQVVVLLFSDTAVPAKVAPFFAIFVTSLLCIIMLINEVKNGWLKVITFIVLGIILFFLYAGILNLHTGMLTAFSLLVFTFFYSAIRLNHEANHYF